MWLGKKEQIDKVINYTKMLVSYAPVVSIQEDTKYFVTGKFFYLSGAYGAKELAVVEEMNDISWWSRIRDKLMLIPCDWLKQLDIEYVSTNENISKIEEEQYGECLLLRYSLLGSHYDYVSLNDDVYKILCSMKNFIGTVGLANLLTTFAQFSFLRYILTEYQVCEKSEKVSSKSKKILTYENWENMLFDSGKSIFS